MDIVVKLPDKDYSVMLTKIMLACHGCEIIELLKGHGDLIDRNLALSDDGLCEFHMYDDYVKMRNYLKSIPTIIEADAKSEDKA